MAIFTTGGAAALDFNNAFDTLFLIGNAGAASGQKSVNGFTTFFAGATWATVGGAGFTYSGNDPLDGTMASLSLTPSGNPAVSVTGLSLDFSDFVSVLRNQGEDAAVAMLLNGSDSVLGAGLDDVLFGGAGDDALTGFAGNDRLYGGDGEDSLYGGSNDDQLFGGANDDFMEGDGGADTLYGGGGVNTMDGGTGVDTVSFADSTARVLLTLNGANQANVRIGIFNRGTVKNIENVTGGDGADVITGDALANLINGSNGNDTLAGGAGADRLIGGGGDDELDGGAGDDELAGNSGVDRLDGGSGADDMAGGSGADLYIVDNAGDTVAEDAGPDIDTVLASVSYALADNVEVLMLTGGAAIDGTGNNGGNGIVGNAAANRLNGAGGADELKGGGGDDHLDGGAGADAMYGESGNDAYVVDDAGDQAIEAAGEGLDTVLASVSFALGANVENLTLTGPDAIDGTGNGLANVLIGNANANRLDGGAGKDEMAGGGGDDVYIVDAAGDSAIEAAGQGIDSVFASVSYALSANVENLKLTGGAAIDGAGNGRANVLFGNGAANELTGGGRGDALSGKGGADTISGGAGKDVLTGGAGADNFVFDMKAGKKHADIVTDFTGKDMIGLDAGVFRKLKGDGVLDAKYFAVGKAGDADDYLVFRDQKLFYDLDGNGKGKAQLIAKFDGVEKLDADDIFLF